MTEHQAAILEAARMRLEGYPVSAMLADPLGAVRRPGDRRSERGLWLALEALAAHEAGDWHRFYAAGHDLLQIERQRATRQRASRGQGDNLSRWIRAFLQERPSASTIDVLNAIESTATTGDQVLADFDAADCLVSYQPSNDSEVLRDVSRAALKRRVERVRGRL